MPGRSGTRLGQALLTGATRLVILIGGVTLAVRLGLPMREPQSAPAGQVEDSGRSGRGKPATPPSTSARRAGHETEDMSGGLMAKLVLMLAVVATIVVCAMVGLRALVTRNHQADQPALTALQTATLHSPPPNLQATPMQDLAQLQERESVLLGRYGWADAAHTRARIPIDRAMALTVGRSLEHAP